MSFIEMWSKKYDEGAVLPYDTFIREALYHPEVGYYKRDRERVGHVEKSDFYTAESLGPVFGELMLSSFIKFCGLDYCKKATFVEIAAEPEKHLLQGVDHPFKAVQVIRQGDEMNVTGDVVLFSNEWLDAQPFKRYIFTEGVGWSERGICMMDYEFKEVLMTREDTLSQSIMKGFPKKALNGYEIDWPYQTRVVLDELFQQDWRGLFVTADYGKMKEVLFHETPQGTARTYTKHELGSDLLDDPSYQDITCHVCWDIVEDVMKKHGCHDVGLSMQEGYIVHHCQEALERIMSGAQDPMDKNRHTLMELLHPGNMGAKFQLMWGTRGI